MGKEDRRMSIFRYPSFTTTIDTTKKCFKMLDGAAKFTIIKMSTPDMKELVEILTEEIKYRKHGDSQNIY